MAIKKFTISGFRGILSPLSLDFVRGRSERSIIIHGRNGTGKSSITDAWEWFHSGKIDHLAREGAREASFRHREAHQGETFVEIEFSNNNIGTVHVDYDFNRVTMPSVRGNLRAFRDIAPHPCHLRYNDLTKFVFSTKAEQYDSLARLMGFAPQVEIQKSLRRVQRRITEEKDRAYSSYQASDRELRQHLAFDPANSVQFLQAANFRLSRNGIQPATTLPEINLRYGDLRTKVTSDPIAQELGFIQNAQRILAQLAPNSQFPISLIDYHKQLVSLRGQEASYLKQLLIQLYERGVEVLSEEIRQGLRPDHCPLCGRAYDGDLLEHVQQELELLIELKNRRDALERQRTVLLRLCPEEGYFSRLASQIREVTRGIAVMLDVNNGLRLGTEADALYMIVRGLLQQSPETLTDEQVASFPNSLTNLSHSIRDLTSFATNAVAVVKQRADAITADTTRAQLVQDYDWISQSLAFYSRWDAQAKRFKSLESVASQFTSIVDSYTAASLTDVQSKFARISGDVKRYFDILEEGTVGISDPSLRLLVDQDRAVVLEIVFHNRTESPAYKYLSESQLNSFGLSVFLASAKSFNHEFRFLILDDVVNSFDGYKRPRVIHLLNQEFSDFQFVLLTHDNVWWNQLIEHFPSWIRLHFQRIEYGSGPIVTDGKTELDSIKELLDADQPVFAGRLLGPYLERKFQEICESFEAAVPFRSSNEYSLREFIQRFLSRVRDKLSTSHSLYQLVDSFDNDAGFRNFCSHWKNPDIQITVEEIRGILSIWEEILSKVCCTQQNCNTLLKYDGNNRFVCHCGTTVLSRN